MSEKKVFVTACPKFGKRKYGAGVAWNQPSTTQAISESALEELRSEYSNVHVMSVEDMPDPKSAPKAEEPKRVVKAEESKPDSVETKVNKKK